MNTVSTKKSEERSALEVRKKRKADEFRRLIRQEWEETERGYRENTPRDAARFPTLSQLAEAAGRDFRKNGHRYGERKKTFRFYWKPANCEPIKVAYYLSRFSSVVLLPPESCYHTRLAMGLPTKPRTGIRAEWEKLLTDYLNSPKAAGKHWFTTNDLLIRVLDIDEVAIKARDQALDGKIMKKLGWERTRKTLYPRRYGYARHE